MSGVRSAEERVTRQHEYIGELDRSLIDLVVRRSEAAAELASLSRRLGSPGVELARENAVLRLYHSALGRPGTSLALLLLGLGRREPLPAGEEKTHD
ncbi:MULTISPECIES: chorismate mutase [unclassified Streptomyces]|uniref:chorismate mutase n=1 Tax=unclassified Streptomyces TaxID=2593676 RepID=UPI000FA898FB|nr:MULTISPECIES: chorismate mutase [unclassified Streptomyces]MDH6454512.1 chorismate mutase [Streptomyces sp. SAI-119]MDH6494930.1 chorismate mutase [Streptomyces sp. SAI-149]